MIITPNIPRIRFSEVYNATTSLIDLGTNFCPYPTAQTICSVLYPLGAGEAGANTVMSVTGSANNNGPRFRFGDAAGFQLQFNASSTGSAGNPNRNGTDVMAYNNWYFTAATWDGTVTATGIRLFYARDARDLVESAYTTTTNGTTAPDYGVGNSVILGNRGDAGRTFNGNHGYVAWFSGALTPQELVMVRSRGPNVFRDRMLLCYVNGEDIGPYRVKARVRTAITQGPAPTYLFPLGPLLRSPQRIFLFPGISVDASSNSGYQTSQSTYTWNHTCTGADRYLRVGISMLSVLGSSVSSITYNGIAMSLLRAKASASGAVRAEMWELIAPATGTNTIAVTLSTALDSIGTAVSFNGVHQTSPSEASNDASATNVGAADATVNVTTVADNAWVSDVVASDDTAITVGAGQTQRANITGTLGSGAESTEGPKSPAGSVTMSWSNVGALATWTIVAAAIRPTAASTLGGAFFSRYYYDMLAA